MKKNIIWSEGGEIAYGREKDFVNYDEFVKTIQEQYQEEFCLVENVRRQACISTLEGLSAESLIPLSSTDIVIENYWLADVSEIGIAGKEKE
ncbi:hypothetical protein [Metabacillus sp. 22489]|uniref:hypothetical protein n=1 Tax=Metabacillus sp. 22489 TaxID=3453928 RepID=UPI003F86C978